MNRKTYTAWLACLATLCLAANPALANDTASADATQLQAALAAGQTTSEAEVRRLLERMALLDDAGPRLNAVVHLNATALAGGL